MRLNRLAFALPALASIAVGCSGSTSSSPPVGPSNPSHNQPIRERSVTVTLRGASIKSFPQGAALVVHVGVENRSPHTRYRYLRMPQTQIVDEFDNHYRSLDLGDDLIGMAEDNVTLEPGTHLGDVYAFEVPSKDAKRLTFQMHPVSILNDAGQVTPEKAGEPPYSFEIPVSAIKHD
jgi:hypothetical protein